MTETTLIVVYLPQTDVLLALDMGFGGPSWPRAVGAGGPSWPPARPRWPIAALAAGPLWPIVALGEWLAGGSRPGRGSLWHIAGAGPLRMAAKPGCRRHFDQRAPAG